MLKMIQIRGNKSVESLVCNICKEPLFKGDFSDGTGGTIENVTFNDEGNFHNRCFTLQEKSKT